tara:strand:- start:405 stop:1055 length:651 start_codon:yes stop_codon:yes gene_type:complete
MTNIVESYKKINSNIKKLNPRQEVKVIAISKTFTAEYIKPLIDFGHNHFGENKVQEAISKWRLIKKEKPFINLHMVGRLQSNKAKNAFEIFDYIHSLDSKKLADIFSHCESNNSKKLKYFIQVNIGNEIQKSGLPVAEVDEFYNYCTYEKNLNVIGLMTIPPNDKNSNKYFSELDTINKSLGLKELSMGMSGDYEDAINFNSTFVRIGSLIFGQRS